MGHASTIGTALVLLSEIMYSNHVQRDMHLRTHEHYTNNARANVMETPTLQFELERVGVIL